MNYITGTVLKIFPSYFQNQRNEPLGKKPSTKPNTNLVKKHNFFLAP